MTDAFVGMAFGQASAEASSSRRRATAAERELDRVNDKNFELEIENNNLKAQISRLQSEKIATDQFLVERTRSASAGLIVMNSVIEAMEYLPKDLRESFRKNLVELSSQRIKELDKKYALEAKMSNGRLITIEEIFKITHEEQINKLGFIF